MCGRLWEELADVVTMPTPQVGPVAQSLLDHQASDGTFYRFDRQSADNPEPWWYHELVTLHAMTSLAELTGDAAAMSGSQNSAAFHHAETQPDHATGQPWGITAFVKDPTMTPSADLLLLAAGVGRKRGGLDVVSRLLLADACVWLDDDLRARAAG
jgi:hypothetical protein